MGEPGPTALAVTGLLKRIRQIEEDHTEFRSQIEADLMTRHEAVCRQVQEERTAREADILALQSSLSSLKGLLPRMPRGRLPMRFTGASENLQGSMVSDNGELEECQLSQRTVNSEQAVENVVVSAVESLEGRWKGELGDTLQKSLAEVHSQMQEVMSLELEAIGDKLQSWETQLKSMHGETDHLKNAVQTLECRMSNLNENLAQDFQELKQELKGPTEMLQEAQELLQEAQDVEKTNKENQMDILRADCRELEATIQETGRKVMASVQDELEVLRAAITSLRSDYEGRSHEEGFRSAGTGSLGNTMQAEPLPPSVIIEVEALRADVQSLSFECNSMSEEISGIKRNVVGKAVAESKAAALDVLRQVQSVASAAAREVASSIYSQPEDTQSRRPSSAQVMEKVSSSIQRGMHSESGHVTPSTSVEEPSNALAGLRSTAREIAEAGAHCQEQRYALPSQTSLLPVANQNHKHAYNNGASSPEPSRDSPPAPYKMQVLEMMQKLQEENSSLRVANSDMQNHLEKLRTEPTGGDHSFNDSVASFDASSTGGVAVDLSMEEPNLNNSGSTGSLASGIRVEHSARTTASQERRMTASQEQTGSASDSNQLAQTGSASYPSLASGVATPTGSVLGATNSTVTIQGSAGTPRLTPPDAATRPGPKLLPSTGDLGHSASMGSLPAHQINSRPTPARSLSPDQSQRWFNGAQPQPCSSPQMFMSSQRSPQVLSPQVSARPASPHRQKSGATPQQVTIEVQRPTSPPRMSMPSSTPQQVQRPVSPPRHSAPPSSATPQQAQRPKSPKRLCSGTPQQVPSAAPQQVQRGTSPPRMTSAGPGRCVSPTPMVSRGANPFPGMPGGNPYSGMPGGSVLVRAPGSMPPSHSAAPFRLPQPSPQRHR